MGPQGGVVGDAKDGGGVQVVAVHGVELDQRDLWVPTPLSPVPRRCFSVTM